jgi:hypothetical protein
VRVALDDRAPYEKMKREYVVRFGDDQIVAQNAAAVTTKLQPGWRLVLSTTATLARRPFGSAATSLTG